MSRQSLRKSTPEAVRPDAPASPASGVLPPTQAPAVGPGVTEERSPWLPLGPLGWGAVLIWISCFATLLIYEIISFVRAQLH